VTPSARQSTLDCCQCCSHTSCPPPLARASTASLVKLPTGLPVNPVDHRSFEQQRVQHLRGAWVFGRCSDRAAPGRGAQPACPRGPPPKLPPHRPRPRSQARMRACSTAAIPQTFFLAAELRSQTRVAMATPHDAPFACERLKLGQGLATPSYEQSPPALHTGPPGQGRGHRMGQGIGLG